MATCFDPSLPCPVSYSSSPMYFLPRHCSQCVRSQPVPGLATPACLPAPLPQSWLRIWGFSKPLLRGARISTLRSWAASDLEEVLPHRVSTAFLRGAGCRAGGACLFPGSAWSLPCPGAAGSPLPGERVKPTPESRGWCRRRAQGSHAGLLYLTALFSALRASATCWFNLEAGLHMGCHPVMCSCEFL